MARLNLTHPGILCQTSCHPNWHIGDVRETGCLFLNPYEDVDSLRVFSRTLDKHWKIAQ
jgi:hypothetical protein